MKNSITLRIPTAIAVLIFVLLITVPAMGIESAVEAKRATLTHDDTVRTYELRIPRSVSQCRLRVPLVVVLHGGGGSGRRAEKTTGFTEKAVRESFIVVYPEGTGRFGRLMTWNAGHCCGYAMNQNVDDVGFIRALLEHLVANYPVDPKRIYITGLSNGGLLTHRLGIELSHKVAAIAPVIAAVFGDEHRPASPVPALMINGMTDKSIPYLGGSPGGCFPFAWDGTPTKPAHDQAAFWAEANGCEDIPDTQNEETLILSQYRCPAGRHVDLYLLKDSGHMWPGSPRGKRRSDAPGDTMVATDIIWDFFRKHFKSFENPGDKKPI